MTREILADAISAARERADRSDRDLAADLAHYTHALPRAVERWSLEPVSWFDGGAGMPTLAVTLPDGTGAVLKVARPPGLAAATRLLTAAGGRGYVRVLAADETLGTLLLERLGEDLWSHAADLATHAEVTVPLLRLAWEVPLAVGEQGGSKAAGLLRILDDLGPRYGTDHPEALDLARAHARHLARTEVAEVVCHGDPHGQNVLRRGDGWALVDPDGFAGERAYDLGVVLRDGCREMLAVEETSPGAGERVLRDACRVLAELSGVDADRIWAWGYVERVTTGLYLHWFGYPEEADSFLATASTLARSAAR